MMMASSMGKPLAPTVLQQAGEARELATRVMGAARPPKPACRLTVSTALMGWGRGFVEELLPAERRDNFWMIGFASRPNVDLPPTPPRTTYPGWSRGISTSRRTIFLSSEAGKLAPEGLLQSRNNMPGWKTVICQLEDQLATGPTMEQAAAVQAEGLLDFADRMLKTPYAATPMWPS